MSETSESARPLLSVLVCTHNPRATFLHQTLEALRSQNLSFATWELLLVDNASSPAVRHQHDISWHPRGKQLRVEILGKTHAIAAAVQEARGDLLVIVDDDNVLKSDYLVNALKFLRSHPYVGVAAGIVEGQYEAPPPSWAKEYLPFLATVNRGNSVLYAFTPDQTLIAPGAGMVLRREVAQHYIRTIANNSVRQGFDPVGKRLSRSGDSDMAMCAYDIGLAKGYDPQLKLIHIIAPERLKFSYIKRLRTEGEYCNTLLLLLRNLPVPPTYGAFVGKAVTMLAQCLRAGAFPWRQLVVDWAVCRARRRAQRDHSRRKSL